MKKWFSMLSILFTNAGLLIKTGMSGVYSAEHGKLIFVTDILSFKKIKGNVSGLNGYVYSEIVSKDYMQVFSFIGIIDE
jgi:hypothetical protein